MELVGRDFNRAQTMKIEGMCVRVCATIVIQIMFIITTMSEDNNVIGRDNCTRWNKKNIIIDVPILIVRHLCYRLIFCVFTSLTDVSQ